MVVHSYISRFLYKIKHVWHSGKQDSFNIKKYDVAVVMLNLAYFGRLIQIWYLEELQLYVE
jgi:hypothetical protein